MIHTDDLYSNLYRFVPRGAALTSSARSIYAALQTLEPTKLDPESAQQVEALITAWLATYRAQHQLTDAKQREWDETQAPAHVYREDSVRPQYLDHDYKLTTPGEAPIYVSEPYSITTEGVQQLADLTRQGWAVTIDGESLHNPARCVRITLARDGSSA